MILGDVALGNLVRTGDPVVWYLTQNQINPASINIRIGTSFLIPRKRVFPVKLGDDMQYRRVQIDKNGIFYLRPGQFALATTMEYVKVPSYLAAFVQGRSSIGRAGLTVQNAGYIDPGFHGHITLELKNETCNTIGIRPGYPVAQLVFEQTTPVAVPYHGKYNGQIEATGSRMHFDPEARRR